MADLGDLILAIRDQVPVYETQLTRDPAYFLAKNEVVGRYAGGATFNSNRIGVHPLNRNDLSDWVYLDPSDVYSVKDDVMKIITLPDYPKGSCVWTVKSTKTYSDPGLTQARNNGTTIPASQYLGKVKQALGVEVKLGMWKGMINVLQLDYSTPVYVMAQNTKVGACPGGGGTQPPNVSPGGPAIGPGSQTTTTPTANQSGISPVTIVIGAFVVGLAMLSSKK